LIRFWAGNYFSVSLITLPVLTWVLYLIRKVENGLNEDIGLTKSEKIQIIITCVLNPLITGAFYFYCWKNQFPKKSSQANIYSWTIAIAELSLAIVLNQLGIVNIL